jgi:hypothetical protein
MKGHANKELISIYMMIDNNKSRLIKIEIPDSIS